MGEIVVADNGKVDGNAKGEERTDRTERASGGSSNSPDTNTSTSGGAGGAGGAGAGGTARTATEKAEVSGLALLTEEEQKIYETANEAEQKRLLKNAKRRQQYAEKKANGGQTVKPRKVRKAKAETPNPALDKASLNMIIASLSAIIASRPNCEHWLLSEAEINSITDPLSKMLADSEAFANLGQYSNQIALVMACATVFIPRMIVTIQKQKEVKAIERTGQHTDTTVKRLDGGRTVSKTETSNSNANGKNDKKSSSNGTNNVANVPWYGSPISG